tara:strand:+ start:39 stop:797 length:759 start_codon:yes stop_codon:yes gene_type:complete
MFNKLKQLILKNWRVFFTISLLFPIPINFIIFIFFDALKEVFLFNNIYYISILYFYSLGSKIKKKNNPRSPIKFLVRFNKTGEKKFWDEFQKDLRHLTGVEVGVLEGKNALSIYNNLNIRKLYLVDPWKEWKEQDLAGNQIILHDQKEHDLNYQQVKNLFSEKKNVEILRMTSLEASKLIENSSLDFVYLDGDHSYNSVMSDLNYWYPKLKEFGVMCGDDFGHISGRGVIKAVNQFIFEKKLSLITGEDNQF